jgi:hypothetical protein
MSRERLVRKRSRGFFSRLGRAWVWVALQFVLTLVLLLAGLAWTRLPDKHVWQVGLTLLIPMLLALCWLELQAGTIRKLARDDGKRVKLIYGAAGIFAWVLVAWAAWLLLDWCDDRIPLWAGYLNSKASAHERAGWLSYQHLTQAMVVLEWIVRWIVVPGKAIPFAAAAALWGWRLPAGRVVRFLFSVRWWVGVALAAAAGVWLPAHLFSSLPSGSVRAQEWHVGMKLAGAYLLAVASWVSLLAWWAKLFDRRRRPLPPDDFGLVGSPAAGGPHGPRRAAWAEIADPEELPPETE